MKKRLTLPFILLGLASLVLWSCATTVPSTHQTSDVLGTSRIEEPWKPVAEVRNDRVYFVFSPGFFFDEDPGLLDRISVVGTFTSWKDSLEFSLAKSPEGLWLGDFPLEKIDVPGNSGMPEFQFSVFGKGRVSATKAPSGYCWGTNFVVLIPPETPESLAEKDRLNRAPAPDPLGMDPGVLGNFRPLTGGRLGSQVLFRSYHPFLPSKGGESEAARLKAVQQLMEQRGIRSVINLTDVPAIANSRKTTEFYKELAVNGNVAFVVTDYETVYYHPEGPEFRAQLKTILEFMAEHPGPYLVHCRLGTDRTGVISGILQALAGVPWQSIAADYELSNGMQIREYRAVRLLEYSFKRMLGAAPGTIPNFSQAMTGFVLASGVEKSTLEKVLKNLSPSP